MNIKEIYFSYKSKDKNKRVVISVDNSIYENEDIIIKNYYVTKDDTKIFSSKLEVKREIKILNFYLIIEKHFNREDKIFINGYQSWSETREYSIYEKRSDFPFLLKPIIDIYKIKYLGDYTIYKYSNKKGGYHSYSLTYIRKDISNYDFIGSLNEDSGWTIFEYRTKKNLIKIVKDCGGRVVKDSYELINLVFIEGNNDNEIFDKYFKMLDITLKEENLATGWTSWYNYYTNISESIILENLSAFVKNNIKIDYFQIDDGYQNSTGDWLIIKDSFPNGMKYISSEIHKSGYKAGLWLAPFVCSVNSRLFKERKNLLLKDKNGKPLPAGYSDVWNGDFYVLDFYNEEFRDYLKEVFDTVLNKWDFDMVKLDFLYAVCLYPRSDKTRGEIMREAIDFLNSLCGNKKILGCGVPLNSAFGRVDYCRIGSDVGLIWEDFKLKGINYRERISTICAIKDAIFRRFFNFRGFLNDPDVFLLRDENIFLNKYQKYTLFVLNLIFGSLLFTSDNINNYDKEKLSLYKSQFPFKRKKDLVINYVNDFYTLKFYIDNKKYTVYSNLKDSSEIIKLENDYFYNSYIYKEGSIMRLNPYETIVLVDIDQKDFQIIGSSGHIFGGSEVDLFEVKGDNIILKINENFINPVEIFIKIASNCDGYKVNNSFFQSKEMNGYKIIRYKV